MEHVNREMASIPVHKAALWPISTTRWAGSKFLRRDRYLARLAALQARQFPPPFGT